MSDPESASWFKRLPVLVYLAVAFMVLGFAVRDVWAFYAGGSLLVLGYLQWVRGA